MELSQEEQVGLIIADTDARFRSGNSVPIERAYITAENYAVLRAFVVAELQRKMEVTPGDAPATGEAS